MSTFDEVATTWTARLGNLRNVVRQHLIRHQLQAHLTGVRTVLDVGCGQGTQAVELAATGRRVTGVDPSLDLLTRAREAAAANDCELSLLQGTLEDLEQLLGDRDFDLVCAHGLLMYLPDGAAAVRQLAARVRPGGLLSFTVRNGDALAFRPGIRGDWGAALAAFESSGYVNELGADATAHRLDDVLAWCTDSDLDVEAWYGVRVFTDPVDPDAVPHPGSLADCLAAEVEAGQRDPYRRLASQLHILARSPGLG